MAYLSLLPSMIGIGAGLGSDLLPFAGFSLLSGLSSNLLGNFREFSQPMNSPFPGYEGNSVSLSLDQSGKVGVYTEAFDNTNYLSSMNTNGYSPQSAFGQGFVYEAPLGYGAFGGRGAVGGSLPGGPIYGSYQSAYQQCACQGNPRPMPGGYGGYGPSAPTYNSGTYMQQMNYGYGGDYGSSGVLGVLPQPQLPVGGGAGGGGSANGVGNVFPFVDYGGPVGPGTPGGLTPGPIVVDPPIPPLVLPPLPTPQPAVVNLPQAQADFAALQNNYQDLSFGAFSNQILSIAQEAGIRGAGSVGGVRPVGPNGTPAPFSVVANSYYNQTTGEYVPVKDVLINEKGNYLVRNQEYNVGQNREFTATLDNAKVGTTYHVAVTWNDGNQYNWDYQLNSYNNGKVVVPGPYSIG